MKRYIVYKHTTPSGKSYIGVTTNCLRERMRAGYTHNRYMRAAVEKYGWENIQTEILADSVTPEEASLLETYYIATYETQDHNKGYNISDGGISHHGFSEETRRKLSASAKKRHRPITLKTREKLRQKARRKAVRNVDTGEEYSSLKEAELAVGKPYKHISDVCNGRRKTAYGYRWEFI